MREKFIESNFFRIPVFSGENGFFLKMPSGFHKIPMQFSIETIRHSASHEMAATEASSHSKTSSTGMKTSSWVLAFEGYSGKFSGNIEKMTTLEVCGDSKVSFYAASALNGVTNFIFDVSGKSSSVVNTGMITMQDHILFGLAAASARNIIVDSSKLDNGGSFVPVTSGDTMASLLRKKTSPFMKKERKTRALICP